MKAVVVALVLLAVSGIALPGGGEAPQEQPAMLKVTANVARRPATGAQARGLGQPRVRHRRPLP